MTGDEMCKDLPTPKSGTVFYQDRRLYAALANYPIAPGHAVIVWRKKVVDLHLLGKRDYEHLMDVVDAVRSAMLSTLKVKKVYLLYMDEARHVHWHLVPAYSEKGPGVFQDKPKRLRDTSLARAYKANLKIKW